MTDEPESPADIPPGLDHVRAVLSQAEDMALPDDLAALRDGAAAGGPDAPHPDMDPPAPDSDPYQGMEPDRDGAPFDPAEFDLEKLREAAGEPLNDFGNGRRVQIHFGHNMLHVPRVGWFVWSGQVWKPNPDKLLVRTYAHLIGALIEAETQFLTVPAEEARMMEERDVLTARILALTDIPKAKRSAEEKVELLEAKARRDSIDGTLDKIDGQIGQRLRHAKAAGNTNSLDNMLTEAAVGLSVELALLDAEPLAINTESGILRFTVTSDPDSGMSKIAGVVLHPHDRAARMTKIMPVRYNPLARANFYQSFLERIQPEASMRDFLQRWFGLSMTGLAFKALCFFHGDGDNGKSLLLELMCRLYGTYAAVASIETLTGTSRNDGAAATPQLVPLIGARIVRAAEPEEGVQWQEGLIKQITGGDAMLIRPMYGASIEVHPRFKPTITGNHSPEIKGTDDGIWGRLKIVPFDVQIPKEDQIPKDEMDAILWAERDGIFAWAVQGLLDFLEGGLQEPDLVRSTTQELRDRLDLYALFLNDVCLVTGDPDDRMWTADLVNAFHFWVAMNKKGAKRDKAVEKAMADKSRKWRSPRTGHKFSPGKSGGYACYLGIKLQAVFARQFSEAPQDHTGRPIVKRPPSERDGS